MAALRPTLASPSPAAAAGAGLHLQDKCKTMEYLTKLGKALKRKNPTHCLYFDLPP